MGRVGKNEEKGVFYQTSLWSFSFVTSSLFPAYYIYAII